ncbi:MAG: shikimate kinase [Bacteroidetes bacterium]|nr:shikimate kinase [Bacteroidota bacterium]MBV6460144.1 Shikimate kinase [Flavobacteriales bacterium]WKZ74016.1 MAG: shikimate kinase [Vicingaceae bacterium]MCL4817410.1 shikimate kinase [Flavobacteriales bacterium]NOG96051.1 shikimate kinase [Bacteroidota bacterium]
MSKNIFLVGFMGCGKTTIGSLLAQKLNYNFIDTDEEIEKQGQLSIIDLFKEKGEQSFREHETEILQQILINENSAVIATGGGMPCFYENMEKMLREGFVIYLKCTPEEIAKRVAGKNSRPLLNTSDNIIGHIQKMLSLRENIYSKAHFITDASGRQTQEVLNNIYDWWQKQKI